MLYMTEDRTIQYLIVTPHSLCGHVRPGRTLLLMWGRLNTRSRMLYMTKDRPIQYLIVTPHSLCGPCPTRSDTLTNVG